MLFPVWALFNPSITVALKLKNWNRTQQKSQLSIKTVRLCHHSSLSNTMFHKPMTTCHVYCSSCADCCTGFPPHTSTQSSNNYISSSCSCWVCLQTARWAVKSTHISTITSKNLQRMALASNRSISVMWHVGLGTFVLLHPSICVGWTHDSPENYTLSIYLLRSSCHPFLFLPAFILCSMCVISIIFLSISMFVCFPPFLLSMSHAPPVVTVYSVCHYVNDFI